MFIVLTGFFKNTKVRVCVESINYYRFDTDKSLTELLVHGHYLYIKESPEEIDAMLKESYITFKGERFYDQQDR